jgi:predicted nucleic acid-binding protein
MTGQVFLDTNILVCAALQPDPRSETARGLLAQRGTISVQVLNEFAHVANRKLRRSWAEIARALSAIRVLCPPPLPITAATHVAALTIAERTGHAIYDALIIASALEAGCGILFSEDLQDGQLIDARLTVRNPFGKGIEAG